MKTIPTTKKVVILGGGIAGLSAAHELLERGFRVELFEQKASCGGKARSTIGDPRQARRRPFGADPEPIASAQLGPGLPGEHGFRFFPRFYKHIIDTMARIPFGAGSVIENLVETSQVQVARFDRPPVVLPARIPRDLNDVQVALSGAMALMTGQFDMADGDVTFFAQKLWRVVTSCEERRAVEYERINWWDFIEAASRSAGYQSYFGNAATRSLVAAKAQRASAKTIGDIYAQIVFDLISPGVSFDRVLNGPTNDVWLDPWSAYLRERGLVSHLNAEVRGISCDAGVIRSATIAIGNREVEVAGDYFVAALPVERMAALLSPSLLAADPSLANLQELMEYVEWMNGIQFYLTKDVPISHGHTSYIDSPWALTSISQPQFWQPRELTSYADGRVRGLLSVCISDWDVRGLNGKEARYCSREEIARECWEQLKRSLNVGGQELLRDDLVHSWTLDADITDSDPMAPGLELNAEPLLVNYVDTWRLRPEASTRVRNLFLAADYVRTFTDLATMEGANEAARRAVNGIIRAANVDAAPCEIWNLHEPEVFLPLRAYDRVRFRKGQPWDGETVALAHSASNLVDQLPLVHDAASKRRELIRTVQRSAQGLVGGSPEEPDALGESLGSSQDIGDSEHVGRTSPNAAAETAAAARSSSDVGLRQLRVIG